MSTSSMDAAYNSSNVDLIQSLRLDLPNNRSYWEQLRILTFGTLFRLLVDTISIPVLVANDKNRFKIKIDTGATGTCRLCIYLPKNVSPNDPPRGVAVHLHGGGWTISRPETEAPICRYIADTAGVVVVAPDYRKAPRYPYPHALEQSYSVLTWIASGGLTQALRSSKHPSSSLQIDPTRIALSGGSAGSNLACALTALCISRPLPMGAHVTAQGLLYPALNLAVPYAEKLARVDPAHVLPQWASRFFLRSYLPPPRTAEDPLVSPALQPDEVLRQFPPTVILTAAYDYLAHEAEEFAEHLRRLDVQVVNRRFEDVGHGFDGIPARDKQQRMLNGNARDVAWGMIAEEFKKALL